jgi:hypothetical protein
MYKVGRKFQRRLPSHLNKNCIRDMLWEGRELQRGFPLNLNTG